MDERTSRIFQSRLPNVFPIDVVAFAAAFLMFLAPQHDASAAPPAQLGLDDAVRMALARSPDVLIQENQIDVARGQQLQASGQFDFVLSSGVGYSKLLSSPLAGAPSSTAFSTGYQAGGAKLLRNGVTAAISLDTVASRGGLAPALPGTESTLGLTLTLPLLKGRGSQEVAAVEDASILNIQVSRQAFRTQLSQTLYQTVSAYWTYRVRDALHQATITNEQRSRDLLASTTKLVEAAEKPRADLVLLSADLADKIAARQAAALAVVDAKNALGRLLGLDALRIGALPPPSDALPPASDIAELSEVQLSTLRSDALARRTDLAALADQIAAATRLAQAASHGLLPKLDLEIGVSYSRVVDGSPLLRDLGRASNGPALTARLNYQFPVQNSYARGVLMERSGELTRLQILQGDLVASVTSGVDNALQAVVSSAAQLKVSQEALQLYERAVSQEIVKQKNGISTLIDVINIEARFVSARVNFLQAQLAHATAIARLRYETGTFLPPVADVAARVDRFTLDLHDLAGLGPLSRQLSVYP
jgi:outer membrane protein TolC